MKDFGKIAQPLTALLKSSGSFQWIGEIDQAFKKLKNALSITPVLALPKFTKDFVVETNTSRMGIRAVLM